jgi:prophage antirepressor-like protein
MDIAVFNFDRCEVRTVMKDGQPWFVGKDVAETLGYANPRKAIRDHCKGACPVGGTNCSPLEPQTAIIPERDVYRLIMRSKLPAAERFEDWVVGEVLPAIRKTGGFSAVPKTFADALYLAANQAKQIEQQQAAIATLQPKADFYDTVTKSGDAVDIGTVAKVLNLGIGRTKLFEFLREEKILMPNNRPYQRHIDDGHFRVIETSFDKPDGSSHVYFKTVAFQKGVDYIRKRLVARMRGAA